MWNDLGHHLRGAESLSIFKKHILKLYRPDKKNNFNIHDPNSLKWIFQLRVGLSPLKSHKRNRYFLNTPNYTCNYSLNAETTQHYLLHCTNFVEQRRKLFRTLNPIPLANNMRFLDGKHLIYLLVYGHEKLELLSNQIILNATINYIRMTSRFSSIQA